MRINRRELLILKSLQGPIQEAKKRVSMEPGSAANVLLMNRDRFESMEDPEEIAELAIDLVSRSKISPENLKKFEQRIRSAVEDGYSSYTYNTGRQQVGESGRDSVIGYIADYIMAADGMNVFKPNRGYFESRKRGRSITESSYGQGKVFTLEYDELHDPAVLDDDYYSVTFRVKVMPGGEFEIVDVVSFGGEYGDIQLTPALKDRVIDALYSQVDESWLEENVPDMRWDRGTESYFDDSMDEL